MKITCYVQTLFKTIIQVSWHSKVGGNLILKFCINLKCNLDRVASHPTPLVPKIKTIHPIYEELKEVSRLNLITIVSTIIHWIPEP